jgi:DNA-3-methyladenine glycosylase II
VALTLHPRAPYRLDLTSWALRRRGSNRVDVWDGRHRRALLLDGQAVPVEVEQRGDEVEPVLEVRATLPPSAGEGAADEVGRQVRRLLGVDVDLRPFYRITEEDVRLRALRDRFLGVRPPRFPTLFEALANAVANQQLSLEVGIELLNRLCEAFGRRTAGPAGLVAFPDAATIAAVPTRDLRALGFSERKAEYLIGLAHAVDTGAIRSRALEEAGRDDATAQLVALRGVGRWSAEYVLLRGVGRLDVFPGDDVGARNKLQQFLDLPNPPGYDTIQAILHPWTPYAGMVYFHLLLDGLEQKGKLER